MKKGITLFSTLVILGFFSAASKPSFAQSPIDDEMRSVFDPEEVERSIVEFYEIFESPYLENSDKLEWAKDDAELLSILPNRVFNDILGHLMIEYRSNPRHRPAIEALISQIYLAVYGELEDATRNQSLYQTVLDDVFIVVAAANAFAFGRGLWKSRGRGLRVLHSFNQSVDRRFRWLSLTPELRKALRTRERESVWYFFASGIKGALYRHRGWTQAWKRQLQNALSGAAIGALHHAIYQLVDLEKLDPRFLLEDAQAAVYLGLERRLKSHAEFLHDSKTSEDDAPDLFSKLRSHYLAQSIGSDLRVIEWELGQLSQAGWIATTAKDLKSTRLRETLHEAALFEMESELGLGSGMESGGR